jgi:hypothetical protein
MQNLTISDLNTLIEIHRSGIDRLKRSYANCKRPQWVDDEIGGLYDKIRMAEYQKSALIETSTGVTNASI